MTKNKSGTINMEAPFDLGTLLDLLLLSLPVGTVLEQGMAMSSAVGVRASTNVWSSIFSGAMSKGAISAMSTVLGAYASGSFGEKWRTRSEELDGFTRWDPGTVVHDRTSTSNNRFKVEKNANGIVMGSGVRMYASDVIPPDTRCFLRGQKAYEKIELTGFPIPATLVDNILVASFVGLYNTRSPEDLGYLYRFVVVDGDNVDSVSCGNQVSGWCKGVVDRYIKTGTVLARDNGSSAVRKVTRVADDGVYFSGARSKTSYKSLLTLAFYDGEL